MIELGPIAILGVGFLVILLGAELFTNGIEWVGRKLDLAEGAVGSVLAAVGTALPETMIPLVAILFGGAVTADEVGLGAILGAPFMLSTLAMFVTGVAVILYRTRRSTGTFLAIDPTVVGKDVRFFAIAFTLAIGTAFVPLEWSFARPLAAVALVSLYALYVRAHFRAEQAVGDAADLAPLRFHRLDRPGHRADPVAPRLRIVGVQVFVALGCIVGGAVVFVDAVTQLSAGLGIGPAVLALVIAPVATELPEKFNSWLWVRQGKDTLAIGNITGAMVFQACLPTVVALLFAPEQWVIGQGSYLVFLSAGIAFAATAAIFLPMARRGRLTGRGLLVGGLFYAGYLAAVLVAVGGGA
ncbi:MAG: sodium:calcium antiporter [Candidatus Limnocylindrales bacterium]